MLWSLNTKLQVVSLQSCSKDKKNATENLKKTSKQNSLTHKSQDYLQKWHPSLSQTQDQPLRLLLFPHRRFGLSQEVSRVQSHMNLLIQRISNHLVNTQLIKILFLKHIKLQSITLQQANLNPHQLKPRCKTSFKNKSRDKQTMTII